MREMNAQEISRLVLYIAGGILGLYLIYHGIVVTPDPTTVGTGMALAGISGVAAPNVPRTGNGGGADESPEEDDGTTPEDAEVVEVPTAARHADE